jgi:hypothetical protein
MGGSRAVSLKRDPLVLLFGFRKSRSTAPLNSTYGYDWNMIWRYLGIFMSVIARRIMDVSRKMFVLVDM